MTPLLLEMFIFWFGGGYEPKLARYDPKHKMLLFGARTLLLENIVAYNDSRMNENKANFNDDCLQLAVLVGNSI